MEILHFARDLKKEIFGINLFPDSFTPFGSLGNYMQLKIVQDLIFLWSLDILRSNNKWYKRRVYQSN